MERGVVSGSSDIGRVGFIGAGSMGGPMVERLLAAGVEVRLYARRAEVTDHFAALGAVIESSVAELAESVEVVVLCPFSEEQLHEILGGQDGLLAHAKPGTIIVQHSTVSVDGIERTAMDGDAQGVTVLDAPVSGRPDDIRRGRLTILVGGDASRTEAIKSLAQAYSSTVVHTGPAGTATATKLLNNLVFAAHMQIAASAASLGRELGISEPDLLSALTVCSGDSYAFLLAREVGDMASLTERITPYLRKDVAAVERFATERGLDIGAVDQMVRTGTLVFTGQE